jgi:amino-acid N-acetyltransferase
MSTAPARRPPNAPRPRPIRIVTRAPQIAANAPLTLHHATAADASAIHTLIAEHLAEGHLLPRERSEIATHAERFVVVRHGSAVVACAELAPLSRRVAELRSFVVRRDVRSRGTGGRMLEALLGRARAAGFDRVCAFTHSPGYFVHQGFSMVPHAWVPEKIATDCHGCRKFRSCGQYAVMRTLPRVNHACVPLAALHG